MSGGLPATLALRRQRKDPWNKLAGVTSQIGKLGTQARVSVS